MVLISILLILLNDSSDILTFGNSHPFNTIDNPATAMPAKARRRDARRNVDLPAMDFIGKPPRFGTALIVSEAPSEGTASIP